MAFYEAYFSNFIEGTEFTPDEAVSIVFDDVVPANRPADAHDIIGTYQIVADTGEMSRAPRDPDEFLDLLRGRHAVLMYGRPDKGPGQLKERDNRVGGTGFVAHELVEGTLRAGLDIGANVAGAFARVMMNAELVAAGESRIVIPTVYRNNYVLALRGATHNRHFDGLLAMLEFAQRYTARVDCTDRTSAEADLTRTNAFRDPVEADNAGIRLTLP